LPRPAITDKNVDHLMIYDAFAHLPIYGLKDLGFAPKGEAGAFIAGHNSASGGRLAAQHQRRTSLVHCSRHVRLAGERALDARHRPAQVEGAKISVCHGAAGMFVASGKIIM
jgi:acetyl-CoA acetyltransferase